MNAFLSQLLQQSLAAGWMILALLLLRPFLKKVPKSISCLLWALAAVRLALPISVESPVSLVPERIADPVQVLPITPIQIIPITPEAAAQAARQPAQPFSWETLLPWLWLAGAAVMAGYALYSYLRLVNRVQVSIRLGDRVYICDNVASPFILGIFRPKIYLPSEMDQAQANLVLAHERAHLRRGDHLWKPLGYGLLCLHWFNPLCWAAFLLFCRDMEQACDESVVKDMTPQDKKAYSAALLHCSLPRSAISACPLAFGEVGVKQRIQGIVNYRRPKFWMMAASLLLCGVLAVCFLTNPVAEAEETGKTTPQEYPVYQNPSENADVLYQLVPGEDYTILRTEPIGSELWAYVECQDGHTFGWLLLGREALAAEKNQASEEWSTFAQQTKIYASPSLQSTQLAQGAVGDAYRLVNKETIADRVWCYIEYQQSETVSLGWILLEEGESVTVPEIKVYSSPSENAHILCRLASGEAYTVLRREPVGNTIWGYVECQDGQTQGWIPLVQLPEDANPVLGTVMGPENLNVRSGPGLEYAAVGFLTPGTQVIILEQRESGGWLWGSIGENSWVCMNYLECYEKHSDDQLVQHTAPAEQPEERYTFAQETVISRTPTQEGQEVTRAKAGESCTVFRREFVNGGSWGFVRLESGAQGWLHFVEDDEALAYFNDYVAAYSQDAPDEAEKYLYFASDYRREFFRDMYVPVTGWCASGIFRVNDDLWGILFSSPVDEEMEYSFVGRMDDRLYVFQDVHQVPEALSENLDVGRYERENAMYLSEGYLECVWIQKRLLEFSYPVKVEIQEDGTRSYAGRGCAYEDMICGTDTWRVAESQPDGQAHCTITLTARDGSTARFWDVDGSVLVTRPEGSQEIYRFYATGEETITMLYDWAKNLANSQSADR